MNGNSPLNQRIPNRREVFRVYYPVKSDPKYLPVLVIFSQPFQVRDICEKGIRFLNPNRRTIPDGMIQASINFPDGSSIPLFGKVIRRCNDHIVLKLDKGIPYKLIYTEQVRLRRLESKGLISYNED